MAVMANWMGPCGSEPFNHFEPFWGSLGIPLLPSFSIILTLFLYQPSGGKLAELILFQETLIHLFPAHLHPYSPLSWTGKTPGHGRGIRLPRRGLYPGGLSRGGWVWGWRASL